MLTQYPTLAYAADAGMPIADYEAYVASAVFLDAFLIRTILVPSLMALMGRRAWWLPGWLDRTLPRLNVDPEQPVQPGAPVAVPGA